jgi:hypothetical protein
MIALEGIDNTAEDLLDACGELTQEPIAPKQDTPYTPPQKMQRKASEDFKQTKLF